MPFSKPQSKELMTLLFLVVLLLLHQNVMIDGLSHVISRSSSVSSCVSLLNTRTANMQRDTKLFGAREDEIRRKIMKLKKTGKIDSSSDSTGSNIDQYADKIKSKMGKSSKLLSKLKPELSAAIMASTSSDTSDAGTASTNLEKGSNNDSFNDDDYEDDDGDTKMDESEEAIINLVEAKLLEKRRKELELENLANAEKSRLGPDIDDIVTQMEEEIEEKKRQAVKQDKQQQSPSNDDETIKMTTSGIGGNWNKNQTSQVDTYRPANGGWGYFPRPKDISRAYGGGKRIERTSTYEDEQRLRQAEEDTRKKLRMYREKVGIEVQSEKDHASEIEEALKIGQLAMQRGIYSTAVSSLEKVTKYCSTNSKLGGKVFLELAMAYEAVGRSGEAIQVYSTLSYSRMEDIKYNAKRLLYGIESMKFMRDEVKSESFSRQKVKQTFIETTGLANIAQNFDEKIYNTAYVDLEKGGGFYRKLTENVVRSVREARQILLIATDSGEVERTKIVQALRSIERKFSEALNKEQEQKAAKAEPVAIMNGVPITRQEGFESSPTVGLEEFNLGDLEQILENINGEWKLQLMADSKGDGVNFFNKTLAWQYFNTDNMTYDTSGPSGFLSYTQAGDFLLEEGRRIISRKNVKSRGSAAVLTDVFGTSILSGAMASTTLNQQIVSVDSELLITRVVIEKKFPTDTLKDYFSVWRRAETGSYSGKKR